MIQFLSSVVPLTEMAGFTPFLLQLLALRPSTCLVSGHPPSSNQSSLSPLPSLLRSSSLSLATHFKIQSNPQNTIVIPPEHMSIPSNPIRSCSPVYSFLQPRHICSSVVFLSTTFYQNSSTGSMPLLTPNLSFLT